MNVISRKLIVGLFAVGIFAFSQVLNPPDHATQEKFTRTGEESVGKMIAGAVIEFPGPESRWAGPKTMLGEVQWSNSGRFELTLEIDDKDQLSFWRGIAGVLDRKKPERLPLVKTRETRKELELLLQAMLSVPPTDSFPKDCIHPVRALIVDFNGTTTERLGCRSRTGWESHASEVLSHWIKLARAD